MYEIYLNRIKSKKPKSKWTLKKVEELCSHDKIFTPEQAIDIGLADAMIELIEIDHKPREN
jgi:ATP-dependent protease ClpP protease subunit